MNNNVSRITRSGSLASEVKYGTLKTVDGQKVPFCYFNISSEIDIGGEALEETTKVLAQGKELCDGLCKMNPQIGSRVYITSAIAYTRNGELCVRLTEIDQLDISGSASNQSGVQGAFGLSDSDFLAATQYFRNV